MSRAAVEAGADPSLLLGNNYPERARLALGAEHGVESEEDLHPKLEEDEEGRIEVDERTLAVIKIGALADLQAMLILDGLPEGERPRHPEEEEEPPA